MKIDLTEKQFRRLLDLVYVGNWVMNSTRGAFAEGGIHEAIMAYEDTMFFEILAQELALRDMDSDAPTPENVDELRERMDTYLGEFEQHGTDNITVEM